MFQTHKSFDSFVDTRQRAYPTLDTSNPNGRWLEEKIYNKRDLESPVLVGNWQEERMHSSSMKEKTKHDELTKKVLETTDTLYNTSHPFVNEQQALERQVKASLPQKQATYAETHVGEKQMVFLDTSDDASRTSTASSLPLKNVPSSTFLFHGNETSLDTPNHINSTQRSHFQGKQKSSKSIGKREQIVQEKLAQDALQATRDERREDRVTGCYLTTNVEIYGETQPINYHAKQPTKPYYKDTPVTFYTQAIKQQKHDGLTTMYASKTNGIHTFSKNTQFSTPISEYTKAPHKIE